MIDRKPSSLSALALPWQWLALLVTSALFVALLEWIRIPAALLLGPMAAAALFASQGTQARVANRPFNLAQAVIGCMIARTITSAVFTEIGRDWPLFVAALLSVVVASSLIGYLLTRWKVLPGSTAIWGSSPGAATAMTLMSEHYGADMRLVAFMQYLRVVMVAVIASTIAKLWSTPQAGVVLDIVWFPPIAWLPFVETLGVILFSSFVGRALRIPAGPLLLPILIGAVLQDFQLLTITLPPWLLAISYAAVGWTIGLRFTREIIVHAARAFPRLAASILCLIAICGCFAAGLVHFAHIDPLTAYLATSPGGADSVAIIAASSKVDASFVMALQTARFMLVVLTGPSLARFIVARTGSRLPSPVVARGEPEATDAPHLSPQE